MLHRSVCRHDVLFLLIDIAQNIVFFRVNIEHVQSKIFYYYEEFKFIRAFLLSNLLGEAIFWTWCATIQLFSSSGIAAHFYALPFVKA